MTDASAGRLPVSANFVNPETMHHPAGYIHVVEVTAGRPVYIAGQVALDPTGALVGPGDIGVQARQVFDNLQAVGAGFEQLVKLTYDLVDATSSRSGARSATGTSTPSSHRPAPPWRPGGGSATTCSSRSRRSP